MVPGLALVILAGIVIGVIALIQRFMGKRDDESGEGSDLIAYLLLAISVGVFAFALAALAATAFPTGEVVIDAESRVATSLAALVVSAPIAVFLWRRQDRRRQRYPASAGWTVYLALIEAVFITAFVVALIGVFEWVLADATRPGWTDVVVFGAVVAFHDWAARRTPPASDGAELPRVVGSAIGLITLVIGLGGALGWVLNELYATLTPTAGGSDLGTSIGYVLAGAPIWWYRWLRPWAREPQTPRLAWASIVSVVGLTSAIAALTWLAIVTLQFLLTDSPPAGEHFGDLPEVASAGLVGILIWWHHRSFLGRERNDAIRAYEYSMTAIGLIATVSSAAGLATAAFGAQGVIEAGDETVIGLATSLVAGASVWLLFRAKTSAAPQETEMTSLPRRFYLLGLGTLMGLVSAGALIATLVVVFQRLLDAGDNSLVVQTSLFIFAGLAAWHLLRINAAERDLVRSEETITPFQVTIICSHPGMIATQLHSAAKVKVIYRSDDAGVISDEMADAIVEAVGHSPSIVWVDSDGFRVAPAR